MPGRRQADPSPRTSALNLTADIVAAILLAAGAFASLTDGAAWRIGGWRLAIHSPWRPWLLALAILAVRNLLGSGPPSYAWLVNWGLTPSALRQPLPLEEERLFEKAGSLHRRAVHLAVVVCGFSLLVGALTWPQVLHLHSVPDLGDPLFSVWRIDWVSHNILRHPLSLFDANIFYPERLTLTYSDSLLVPALMSAPLFWMGVPPIVAYNLLLLSGFVLSGVTTFLLVRALTGRVDAALVAGAIFAVYPYRYEHYSHLELQMTMWAPLALWMLHRTMAFGRLRDGLATGLAFALQTLSTLYTGLFLALCMTSLGTALWLGRGRPRQPLKVLAAGMLLAAVLIAPVAAAYQANKPMMGDRDYSTVEAYSAEGRDYLNPHFRSLLYGRWADATHPERQLFPRLMPVALTAIALWPPLSVARIGYALSLIVAIDGSLGAHGALYPWLYAYVAPFRGLRVPARFSVIAGLVMSVLAGYGSARLVRRWPGKRAVLVGGLLLLVFVEALPRMPLERVWDAPPDIYRSLSGKPPSVLAEFPMPEDYLSSAMETRYLYFATFHRQRIVNGNSGFFPPSYHELLREVHDFPSDRAMNYLRARGVEYVTVHGAFYGAENYQRMLSWIGARQDLRLVAAAPWEGSESRLYRVAR